MLKIITIIGARPQFIKAAALSRAIRNLYSDRIKEVIVHTGQHYDENLSRIFFDELNIPKPDYSLNTGSASHGVQTAMMIEKLEEILLSEKPDYVVLYGDTNSTLAGSVAASKINIPIIHIEAGLRSFNKSMPEEINRIVCDHSSTLLFTPTKSGLNNLINEGFNPDQKPPYSADNPGIFHCGDVMYDNSLFFTEKAKLESTILSDNNLQTDNFLLATVHRDNNTDISGRLSSIFEAFQEISNRDKIDIILPLHPRTLKNLKSHLKENLYQSVMSNPNLKIIQPVSFLDVLVLENNCRMILTDSGGLQKEAYFCQKPVIILRPETEWIEIVENGAGIIADVNTKNIIQAYDFFKDRNGLMFPSIYGDGKAAEFICRKILETN